MLAIKREYKSNVIPLSIPPQPNVGDVLTYRRAGRIMKGKLIGTHWYQVQRHHAIVCEYIVTPLPGYSNLSFNVVSEEDIIWSVKPVCPRCQDQRIIGIRGDESVDCPDCGFADEWKVF